MFAAKVSGTANLTATLSVAPISSIAHFSSLSSFFGNPGQANYAAANEVLNERAAVQHSSGLPSVSIMWGPWAIGMAASNNRMISRFKREGVEIILPAAGLHAILSAISSSHAVVVAASLEWSRFMARNPAKAVLPMFVNFRPNSKVRMLEPERSGSTQCTMQADAAILDKGTASDAHVREKLAEIVHSMLGPEVLMDQPMMEAGLDSLLAVELRNIIAHAFDTDFSATVTFDYPSISTLATHITERAQQDMPTMQPSKSSPKPVRDFSILKYKTSEDLQIMVENLLGTTLLKNQPFMEAGLDSMSAVELRSTLIEKFGMELPATVMFDYPSIQALAEYISGRISSGSLQSSIDYNLSAAAVDVGKPALSTTDIMGVSARYPGETTGVDGFWRTVDTATDLQRRVPLDRWDLDPLYVVDIVSGIMAINAPFAAFCSDVGNFDPLVFGLTPAEAFTIDPQQRLLMEEAHNALEDAQMRSGAIRSQNTGVFSPIALKVVFGVWVCTRCSHDLQMFHLIANSWRYDSCIIPFC